MKDNSLMYVVVCMCALVFTVLTLYIFLFRTHNQSLHFAKQGHEYFVVPPGDHFFWPGSYVGRKVCFLKK